MNGSFGKRVARLPNRGTLLYATDLQGNLADYERMKELYAEEERRGNEPFLLFCGDLVHGPGDDLADPEHWPEHLGTFYEDRSIEIVLDYIEWSKGARTVSLLGNHEHAHVGGPVVGKFYMDEAAALESRLGEHIPKVRELFASLPLLAVAPCGAAFTHGAPAATEPDLESFERLQYEGFRHKRLQGMHEAGTLGSLLWARHASQDAAKAFLAATSMRGRPNAFVAYGHDVVREGYEILGDEQICLSTSFGLFDANKVYLRLDLAASYESVHDLRDGIEIMPLYERTHG